MPNYFDKYDSIETQGNYFDKYDEQEKPQRSPLSEIGTGLKRGIIGELPRQVGQAMRWAGEENDPGFRGSLYRQGKSIADMARERLSRPENQLHPEQHGMVTNALAEGAEMLAPSVAAPLVAGGLVTATSAALPAAAVSAPVALGISALAGSLPAGMAQAQDTFERVKEAGGDEATAKSAGWKSGAIEAGGETVGTYLGGKLLGIGGKAISKAVAPTVGNVIGDATNTAVMKPFAKQLVKTALGEVGTEMAQGAGQAAVERAAGVDVDPWTQAKEAIGPTLGMTALLAPFGLAGHYRNSRRAEAIDRVLGDPQAASAEDRAAVVNMIHQDAVGRGIQDADAWRAGALQDVAQGLPIRRDVSVPVQVCTRSRWTTTGNEPGRMQPWTLKRCAKLARVNGRFSRPRV